MTRQEKFLALYKDYENVIHDHAQDVRAVEDTADAKTKGRLWMCRSIRNYLSHNNDPGFVEPTEKMMRFLEEEIKAWRLRGDVAKKHSKTMAAATCADKDKCHEVLAKMAKLKWQKIPVLRTGGKWELVSIFDVANAAILGKTTKMSAVKGMKEKPLFCEPLQDMGMLDPERVHLCTNSGEPDSKILGVVCQ